MVSVADEHYVLNSDYNKQLYATTNNCQLSTKKTTATSATTNTTTISCFGHTNTTEALSTAATTTPTTTNTITTATATTTTTIKYNFYPMTKQLSSNTTPAGVTGAASGTAAASTASSSAPVNGVVRTTNGSLAATFLNTNLTPTIISPTASLTPATINSSQYSSSTGTIPKKTQLQIPSHTHNHTFTIQSNNNATSTASLTCSPTNNSASLTNHCTTTTTTTSPASAGAVATSVSSAKTTTTKKSQSCSTSTNDTNGRSAALERAYVHDVYENCEEPTGSLRPRVAQFLSNLEAGSVVCDVGCGSGRYLTQCNPSICTVGVDRCYRLSRVAKEKGGEVSLFTKKLNNKLHQKGFRNYICVYGCMNVCISAVLQ